MSSTIRRMDKETIIKWLICIVLTVICLVIPEQGFYNYKVKCFLAVTVFALALSAMELVPNFVVAIIMPALWVFVGVAPIELVMSSWTNSTIIMLVGAYFMAASLENCGLMKRLAFMLMCKVKGSYFGLLLSVLLVSILINILTFGSAYVLMPGLVLGLCLSLNGMKKTSVPAFRQRSCLAVPLLMPTPIRHQPGALSLRWGLTGFRQVRSHR